LLCTTIFIDCNSQITFLYVKESELEILERSESGVGNFGKVGVGVGYFTSDPSTLVQ